MSLWRDRDFRRFWAATGLSHLGSAVTFLALPLTAIHFLDAGAAEMGLLVALERAPILAFGLLAGVWVDRLRRRPLMIAADLGCAALLAAIPLAAYTDRLSLALLYATAFGIGTLGLAHDLAATSFLPSLVDRHRLYDANGKLQMTHQLAVATGRGLGGLLIARLGAPLTIALDAISYLVSAVALARIRRSEPAPVRSEARAGFLAELREGVRAAFRHPWVRAMIVTSTLGSFAGAIAATLLVLFLSRELALGAAWIGALTAAQAAAGWLGALVAARAADRAGPGPVLVSACFVSVAGAALLPTAGLWGPPAVVVAVALSLSGFGLTLYSVNQISLRQAVIDDALLGRVNATRRVLVFGVIPLGALVAGGLGEFLGLRPALGLGAALMLVSALYALASPLRTASVVPASDRREATVGEHGAARHERGVVR